MTLGYKEVGRNGNPIRKTPIPENHEETIDRVINASHCPKEILEQIRATSTNEELTALGYTVIEQHPTTAYNIFKYTRDQEGRRNVIRTQLLHSSDPMLQTYAYTAISETDPSLLKEFGDYLLGEGKNPELTAQVFAEIGDKEGVEKAVAQIEGNDPKKGERLRRFYSAILSRVRRAASYFTRMNGGYHKKGDLHKPHYGQVKEELIK